MPGKKCSIARKMSHVLIKEFFIYFTGIKFIGKDKLLSAAIDQRVVMHKYLYNDSILTFTPTKKIMTFVSDVQGLTLLDTKDSQQTLACVHGQGLEVILIDDDNN